MPQKPLLIYSRKADDIPGYVPGFAAADLAWPTVKCRNAEDVIRMSRDAAFCAILIDLEDESDLSLIEYCKHLMPVLVAASETAIDLRLQALARGAVDHLVMPFHAADLRIRVSTAIRRDEVEKNRFIRQGCVVLDKVAGLLGDGLRWVTLTVTERQAFSLLLEQQGQPVSRDRLKQIGRTELVSDNAIQVLIHRLRSKAHACGLSIKNLRGEGYLLEYVG